MCGTAPAHLSSHTGQRTAATSHQWLGWTPSKRLVGVPGMAKLRRFGDRTICTSLSRRLQRRPCTSVGDRRLACQPRRAIERRLEMAGPNFGHSPQRADDLAGRPQQRVAAGPGAVVQHDVTAGATTRTASRRQRQRIVVMAVLERDVAERHVGRVVGQGDRATVGDGAGLQPLGRPNWATVSRHRSRNAASRSQATTRANRRVKLAVIRPMPEPISTRVCDAVRIVTESERRSGTRASRGRRSRRTLPG